MLGALQGFSTITAVIAVGWVLAHRGILGLEARQILADLAFFVASPALLLVVLAKAPVGEVLSSGAVSYTHLDVYKRQVTTWALPGSMK